MRERENKTKTEAEEVLEERKKREKEGKSKEEGRPVVEGKSESQGKPASEGKPKEGKPAMKPRAAGKHPSGVDAQESQPKNQRGAGSVPPEMLRGHIPYAFEQ